MTDSNKVATANGSTTGRDGEMRQRIISHMNKDHADSLTLYLRHYCQIPASSASPAKMTDITTSHMIIESPWGRNMIPFEPPMKSFAEARERAVAMHNTSLNGLGLSDIKVDRFAPPNQAWQWMLHLLCGFCFSTLRTRAWLDPASGGLVPYIWSIGGLLPPIAQLSYAVGPLVFWGMVAIHATEASWMAWGRLRKHQVQVGSFAWIAWIAVTFNGGMASFTRFDSMIRDLEQSKKKS